MIPTELKEELQRFKPLKKDENIDPRRRPFITLTDRKNPKKKIRVYLHFLEDAEVSHWTSSHTTIRKGSLRFTVKETAAQIKYLYYVEEEILPYNEELFEILGKVPKTISYEEAALESIRLIDMDIYFD